MGIRTFRILPSSGLAAICCGKCCANHLAPYVHVEMAVLLLPLADHRKMVMHQCPAADSQTERTSLGPLVVDLLLKQWALSRLLFQPRVMLQQVASLDLITAIFIGFAFRHHFWMREHNALLKASSGANWIDLD
jgi:hypothetical protein